jgi:LPS-assembly protein
MRSRAAIAAAVLSATSVAALAQSGSAPGQQQTPPEVELTADRIVYDWEKRKLELEGHVVATRGPLGVLRAARGTLDRTTGILRLEGGVIAVQGREIVTTDAAVVDLENRSADLSSATMFLKDRTAPPPQTLTDPKTIRGAGKNALVLTGKRVRRLPSGALVAEDVTMTPCDCVGEPDYVLGSPHVEVKDDRARLTWPRLDILGASIPLLVPLSLPLTERQSGLLFPPLQYSSITGFGTEVPLFVTLGRSYDFTIAPGIFSGSGGPDRATKDLGNAAVPGVRSVSGPRLGFQFRYAPVEGTAGQLDLDLVRDGHRFDSPGEDPQVARTIGEVPSAPGRGIDGVRGVLRYSHRTEAPGWLGAVQGSLTTDNMYLQDTELRELDRFLDALRTDAGVVRAQGAAALGIDATLLFDVRNTFNGANPASGINPGINSDTDRRILGDERRATFQRLPSAFGQLAPTRVGPLAFSAELSATRFAPFVSLDPRERDTGFGPTDLGAPNANTPVTGLADPLGLGRARAIRFDASPRLSWGAEGLPILLSGDVGVRADAWLFDDDSGRNRQRAYTLATARAEMPLQRTFGNLLHTITPGIEIRGITPAITSGGPPIGDPFDAGGTFFSSNPSSAQQGVAPGLPPRAGVAGPITGVPAARRGYDELDGAAPEDGEALATARVVQGLWTRAPAGRAAGRIVTLELRQDFVLRAGSNGARLGETGASAGFAWGAYGIGAAAQYDWSLRRWTYLTGSLTARLSAGSELHGGMSLQRGAASERIRAGADELFAAAQIASDPGLLFGSASAGGSSALPWGRQGLRINYDASHLLSAGALPPNTADWTHRLAFTYETPCRCAAFQLYAAFPFTGGRLLRGPSIGVLLDLKSLGSFGLSST